MPLYSTSDELLYNLEAVTGSEAKRKWRQSIKENGIMNVRIVDPKKILH